MTLDFLDRPTPPLGLQGRARRRSWWIALGLLIVVPIGALAISSKLSLFLLMVLVANLFATTVRRAHDIDAFGLLPVLSLTGPGFLAAAFTQFSRNGEFPVIPVMLSLLLVGQLLQLAVKKGTDGPNRFGERAW